MADTTRVRKGKKKQAKKQSKRKTRAKRNFSFKNAEGVEYEVLFRKPDERHFDGADGICVDPSCEKPKIHINPYMNKQAELNTIVHEFTHAFFWDKSEREVYKFANTVSKFLYNKCGWRKIESKRNTVYKGK